MCLNGSILKYPTLYFKLYRLYIMNYYAKYNKYKNKYINLKYNVGGGKCTRDDIIICLHKLIGCENDSKYDEFIKKNIIMKEINSYTNITNILFSQATINDNINNPKKIFLSMKDLFEKLVYGVVNIDDIPTIEVNIIKKNEKIYFLSKDNRRLCLFYAFYMHKLKTDKNYILNVRVNINPCIDKRNLVPICEIKDDDSQLCDLGYFYEQIKYKNLDIFVKDDLVTD
jgi:hypothetical protein